MRSGPPILSGTLFVDPRSGEAIRSQWIRIYRNRTTEPAVGWTDSARTNPVTEVLTNQHGYANLIIEGVVRLRAETADGTPIYTWDDVSPGQRSPFQDPADAEPISSDDGASINQIFAFPGTRTELGTGRDFVTIGGGVLSGNLFPLVPVNLNFGGSCRLTWTLPGRQDGYWEIDTRLALAPGGWTSGAGDVYAERHFQLMGEARLHFELATQTDQFFDFDANLLDFFFSPGATGVDGQAFYPEGLPFEVQVRARFFGSITSGANISDTGVAITPDNLQLHMLQVNPRVGQIEYIARSLAQVTSQVERAEGILRRIIAEEPNLATDLVGFPSDWGTDGQLLGTDGSAGVWRNERFTAALETKLAGIAAGAEVNPTDSELRDQIDRIAGGMTWRTGGGEAGLASVSRGTGLTGDGTPSSPLALDLTSQNWASTTRAGLMSSAEHVKLGTVERGAQVNRSTAQIIAGINTALGGSAWQGGGDGGGQTVASTVGDVHDFTDGTDQVIAYARRETEVELYASENFPRSFFDAIAKGNSVLRATISYSARNEVSGTLPVAFRFADESGTALTPVVPSEALAISTDLTAQGNTGSREYHVLIPSGARSFSIVRAGTGATYAQTGSSITLKAEDLSIFSGQFARLSVDPDDYLKLLVQYPDGQTARLDMVSKEVELGALSIERSAISQVQADQDATQGFTGPGTHEFVLPYDQDSRADGARMGLDYSTGRLAFGRANGGYHRVKASVIIPRTGGTLQFLLQRFTAGDALNAADELELGTSTTIADAAAPRRLSFRLPPTWGEVNGNDFYRVIGRYRTTKANVSGGEEAVGSADSTARVDDLYSFEPSPEYQTQITGTQGQVVGFDAQGNPEAQEAPSGLPEIQDNNRNEGFFMRVVSNVAAWVKHMIGSLPDSAPRANDWGYLRWNTGADRTDPTASYGDKADFKDFTEVEDLDTPPTALGESVRLTKDWHGERHGDIFDSAVTDKVRNEARMTFADGTASNTIGALAHPTASLRYGGITEGVEFIAGFGGSYQGAMPFYYCFIPEADAANRPTLNILAFRAGSSAGVEFRFNRASNTGNINVGGVVRREYQQQGTPSPEQVAFFAAVRASADKSVRLLIREDDGSRTPINWKDAFRWINRLVTRIRAMNLAADVEPPRFNSKADIEAANPQPGHIYQVTDRSARSGTIELYGVIDEYPGRDGVAGTTSLRHEKAWRMEPAGPGGRDGLWTSVRRQGDKQAVGAAAGSAVDPDNRIGGVYLAHQQGSVNMQINVYVDQSYTGRTIAVKALTLNRPGHSSQEDFLLTKRETGTTTTTLHVGSDSGPLKTYNIFSLTLSDPIQGMFQQGQWLLTGGIFRAQFFSTLTAQTQTRYEFNPNDWRFSTAASGRRAATDYQALQVVLIGTATTSPDGGMQMQAGRDGDSTRRAFIRSAATPVVTGKGPNAPSGWTLHVVPAGTETAWVALAYQVGGGAWSDWQGPFPLAGEKGDPGDRGVPGDSYRRAFIRSATEPTVSGRGPVAPTDWSLTPPPDTQTPTPLWVCYSSKIGSADWTLWAGVSRETGETGPKGDPGPAGAQAGAITIAEGEPSAAVRVTGVGGGNPGAWVEIMSVTGVTGPAYVSASISTTNIGNLVSFNRQSNAELRLRRRTSAQSGMAGEVIATSDEVLTGGDNNTPANEYKTFLVEEADATDDFVLDMRAWTDGTALGWTVTTDSFIRAVPQGGIEGSPGQAGPQGPSTEPIFRLAANPPATPSFGARSAVTADANWSFTPQTPTDTQRVYVSYGAFDSTGSLAAGTTWTVPRQHSGIDGAPGAAGPGAVEIFRRSASQPTTPSGDGGDDSRPTGWFLSRPTTPADQPVWKSRSVFLNGGWSAYDTPTRDSGLDGVGAQAVQVRRSEVTSLTLSSTAQTAYGDWTPIATFTGLTGPNTFEVHLEGTADVVQSRYNVDLRVRRRTAAQSGLQGTSRRNREYVRPFVTGANDVVVDETIWWNAADATDTFIVEGRFAGWGSSRSLTFTTNSFVEVYPQAGVKGDKGDRGDAGRDAASVNFNALRRHSGGDTRTTHTTTASINSRAAHNIGDLPTSFRDALNSGLMLAKVSYNISGVANVSGNLAGKFTAQNEAETSLLTDTANQDIPIQNGNGELYFALSAFGYNNLSFSVSAGTAAFASGGTFQFQVTSIELFPSAVRDISVASGQLQKTFVDGRTQMLGRLGGGTFTEVPGTGSGIGSTANATTTFTTGASLGANQILWCLASFTYLGAAYSGVMIGTRQTIAAATGLNAQAVLGYAFHGTFRGVSQSGALTDAQEVGLLVADGGLARAYGLPAGATLSFGSINRAAI